MVANVGLCAGLLAVLLTLATPGAAQQPPTAPAEPPAGTESEGADDEGRNEVALVLAGTRERGADDTSFTMGLEYARRLGARWSMVGEFEYVSGPDSWVFAAPLAFQPVGALKLFTGPGFERRPVENELESGEHDAVAPATARETLFLWRVGTSYSWELSRRYVLGPFVCVDFIQAGHGEWERALVFGITAGVAF